MTTKCVRADAIIIIAIAIAIVITPSSRVRTHLVGVGSVPREQLARFLKGHRAELVTQPTLRVRVGRAVQLVRWVVALTAGRVEVEAVDVTPLRVFAWKGKGVGVVVVVVACGGGDRPPNTQRTVPEQDGHHPKA